MDLAGLGVWFQCAALDLTNPLRAVPFYTTNALRCVIQP